MINKAILLGKITNKCMSTLNNGDYYNGITIITERQYIDKGGYDKKFSVYHDVRFFGNKKKLAENLNKGDLVFIEGEINFQKLKKNEENFNSDKINCVNYYVAAEYIKKIDVSLKLPIQGYVS